MCSAVVITAKLTSSCKGTKDRMKSNGIDREHDIPASLTPPMALEGILLCLSLLTVVKVLHCNSAFNGAEGVACAVGIAAYAPCLVLQGTVSDLLWLSTLDAAYITEVRNQQKLLAPLMSKRKVTCLIHSR